MWRVTPPQYSDGRKAPCAITSGDHMFNRITTMLLSAAMATPFALASAPVQAATEKYLPSVPSNAPPAKPFGQFDRIELRPVTIQPPFDKDKPNQLAREHLQTHLDERVTPLTVTMNARPAKAEPASTLVVEPIIVKVKYFGVRASLTAFGSSQVLMKVRITDKATGEVVAEPEFYQRANGWGAYASGSTESQMLVRIADLVAAYLNANMETAVGGPTGA